jgi:hypothetical protein
MIRDRYKLTMHLKVYICRKYCQAVRVFILGRFWVRISTLRSDTLDHCFTGFPKFLQTNDMRVGLSRWLLFVSGSNCDLILQLHKI